MIETVQSVSAFQENLTAYPEAPIRL